MAQSEDWQLASILGNLTIVDAIEERNVALVPAKDPRIRAILKSMGSLRLLNSFEDQMRRRRSPTFLIVTTQSAPAVEALVAFRNCFAVSCITYGWQKSVANPNTWAALYSDYFDFYPLSLSLDGKHMVFSSPALVAGEGNVAKFRGQTSPGVPNSEHLGLEPDPPVYDKLMAQWRRRYAGNGRRDWRTRALFRSLEMAYNAAAIPDGNRSTIYDHGANVALWVSALEVLVHPRKGKSNLQRVLELLSLADWKEGNLKRKCYLRSKRARRQSHPMNRPRCNLVEKLCRELYDARHRFLHGNNVSINSLYFLGDRNRLPLTAAAPLIYAVALRVFLGVETPWMRSSKDYGKYFLSWTRHARLEEALRRFMKRSQP